MITKMDDYLIHQIPSTIDHVADGDPNWYDRYYFAFFDTGGEICVFTGMCVYPNLGVMDGYGCVVLGGKTQRNVRVSRELNHDRENTRVGPLSVQVIDGLRRLRIVLQENDFGLAYDLELETSTPAFDRNPLFRRLGGKMVQNFVHYGQGGWVSGKVSVDGKGYKATKATWRAVRDHSWGVRKLMNGPERPQERPGERPYQGLPRGYKWVPIQFDDCFLEASLQPGVEKAEIIYPWGDSRERISFIGMEFNKQEFEPSTRRWKSGQFILTDEQEQKVVIQCRRLTTCYVKGAAYGGIGGYYHGMYKGPAYIEGETWDISDPKVIADGEINKPPSPCSHVSEFRMGNKVGYGLFEHNDYESFERPYSMWMSSRRKWGT